MTRDSRGEFLAGLKGSESAVLGPGHGSTRRQGLVIEWVATTHWAGVLGALVVLVALFGLANPAFLAPSTIRSMVQAISYVGIIAVGETLLIIGGEFDLSVGSVAGASAVSAGMLATAAGLPLWLAILGGVAVGCLFGLVNGVIVTKLHMPAFVATLGMLFVARGVAYVLNHGKNVYPLPPDMVTLGQSGPWDLGLSFWVFLGVLILAGWVLRDSTYGRHLAAGGSNVVAARLAGISTDRVKIIAFCISGGLAALAGMTLMGQLGRGDQTIGTGWEFAAITAVVVGGTSLYGGVGGVFGTLIGLLLLRVLASGLVFVGVSATWQEVFVGALMVSAVALDQVRRRWR